MTLQFNAPYRIDPNYNPEQEGLDRISQSLNNISGTTDRWSQEKRQKDLQDLQMSIMKAQEGRAVEKWGLDKPIEYGVGGIPSGPNQNMTPSQPMVQSNPFGGGIPEGPGQNMTPDTSRPQTGGMIEKFRQWQNQRRSAPEQSQPMQGMGMPSPTTYPGLSQGEMDASNQWGTKRAELYSKAASDKRLFQDEARKERETAVKEKRGPGNEKGTWHLNQFTGQYDFYPNTGPSGGMGGQGGVPTTPAPGSPAPIPFKERAKLEGEARDSDILVNSVNDEIDRVFELNKDSHGGFLGGIAMKAKSAMDVGSDDKTYTNTVDVVNTMQAQVSRVLKSTFGGQLSDGERMYLNKVYGALPDMSRTERAIAMQNVKKTMIAARDRARAKAGMGGVGGGSGGGGQQGQGQMKVINGVRYEKRGGQWYPAQ